MIPLRLELINFLAYRRPAPLDFTGIHVAVLCGENGAGKSSLLDAITWAIWGRARAKTDNELVHQGQSEMRVEFTFSLGDQSYRVIRAKRVGKSATGLLDFQMCQPTGEWVSIDEGTIPKTQDKIIRTLRLTYETFINSAYLMQGQADEFTGKRPTERKQVLADILGLQEWERYEDRAKDRLKAIDLRLAGIDALLAEIEAELGRRPEYEQDLRLAQAQMIEVGERLRQAEAGWAEIDRARQAMIALDRQSGDITRRIKDSERELATLDIELREAQARADTAGLQRDLLAIQQNVTGLEAQEAERDRVTIGRNTAAELSANLRGQNDAARAEADGLKKRLETLQAATEPRCPTCGQVLEEAARTELVERLQQIKERVSRATPGPWTLEKPTKDDDGWAQGVCIGGTMGGRIYANPPGGQSPYNDAVFMAHARTDIPWLLEQVESWIPCSERLPEFGTKCMVVWHGVTQDMTYWFRSDGWQPIGDDAADVAGVDEFSHWRPLPPAPEER
jgi:exonuclease SbcC